MVTELAAMEDWQLPESASKHDIRLTHILEERMNNKDTEESKGVSFLNIKTEGHWEHEITHTSLVKDELKSAIRTRRLSKGLPEVTIKPECASPKRYDVVTEEEEERRSLRRERNRIAATKCRMKRKLKETQIVEEHKIQVALNRRLKEEKKKLENERERLTMIWKSHSFECSLPPS